MKKILKEVFNNLAKRGDIHLMILASNESGIVPSVKQLYGALSAKLSTSQEGCVDEIKLALDARPSKKTLINFAKALITFGDEDGTVVAAKLKDADLCDFALNDSALSSGEITVPKKILCALFKHARTSGVYKFRKECVGWGEYKLALIVSSWQREPLTKKEIDEIMSYNRDLPSLTFLIAGAKRFKRKLTNADIQKGINDAFDNGGNWDDAFKAIKLVGRKISSKEWKMLLDQTRRWVAISPKKS
jgi:hypothetical protein